MSWTQPMCAVCWLPYSYGKWLELRAPVQVIEKYRERENCCFCGTETRSGIYVRVDPTVAPFSSTKTAE